MIVLGLTDSDRCRRSAGVRTAVRSSAVHATNRLHWSVAERLWGHRHDAESTVRFHQTQVREQVNLSL